MRIALLLLVMMALYSCDEDMGSTGTKLDLVFELRYDGTLLSGPVEWYELNDSVRIRFSKVNFYLSDFTLNTPSEPLSLLDVVHLSFLQNTNGDAIQEMQQTLSFDVPPGNYISLTFGLGLTPSQNSTKPSDHEPGSALSLTSEYWTAWESYVFEKIEGTFQLNDGEEKSVALHVGSNPAYRILEWRDEFALEGDQTKKIIIPIDLKYILKDYPLIESPVLHQLAHLPQMELIANAFSESMRQ